MLSLPLRRRRPSTLGLDGVDAAEPSHAGHRPRVSSLDGLRGVAAFIVMISHALVASSVICANSYAAPVLHQPVFSMSWFFIRTPLHVVWAGQEMVLVFFVLSGYVLALPAVRLGRRWFDSSYYPRRVVRLYVPAWFALLFGALLHELHRRPVSGADWWLNAHAGALSLSDTAHAATLLNPRSLWAFTSVLWSLSDEVLFSLLLPGLLLLVLICARRRSSWLLAAVACFAAAVLFSQPAVIAEVKPGWLAYDLRYIPVFVLGSLLALAPVKFQPPERSCLPVAVAAICLLTSSYMWKGAGMEEIRGWAFVLDIIGAVAVVWVVATYRSAGRALSSPPLRWLGSRSFSLYLVHEPIIVAVAFLGGRHSVLGELLVAVPVSLVAAELFWRLIEHPTIRLARLSGDVTRAGVLRLRSTSESNVGAA